MKNIFVIFLACFAFNLNCDVLDGIIRKAERIENLVNSRSRYPQKAAPYRVNSSGNYNNNFNRIGSSSSALRRGVPLLKRDIIFPKEIIKQISLSPDGQKIAYLYEENGNQCLKVISSSDRSTINQIIKERFPITNFAFVGKNIIYTYRGEDNNLSTNVWSHSEKKSLNISGKSIKILAKNNSACLIEVHDGERYVLHKASMSPVSSTEIKELSESTLSLFDKKLSPKVIIKNEDGLLNVYVKPKKATNVSNNDFEDSVSIGEDDGNDLQQIDQIEDLQAVRYLSVDNSGSFYKAVIERNCLQILRFTSNSEEGTLVYKLNGVGNFDQCKINVDPNGKPMSVTVNNRRYQHYSWDSSIKNHLNLMSKNFESWYLVNTTNDGTQWLICSVSDRSFDKFYLYDTRTRRLSAISKLNTGFKNQYLRSTECHFITLPSSSVNKEHIQMFLTRGVNSNRHSPLMILTNSDEQYSWKYEPVVQLLANRGFNVLCVNYRKDILVETPGEVDIDDFVENSVSKEVSDITRAVNWAIKNNIGLPGNITLLAYGLSSNPMMHVYLKNSKVFAGYISIASDDSKLKQMEHFEIDGISKPTLLLGGFENSEAINPLIERIPEDVCSVISFKGIDQKLSAGLVEKFLTMNSNIKFSLLYKSNNRKSKNIESLTQREINQLQPIRDGLSLLNKSGSSNLNSDQENMTDEYSAL